MGPRRDVLGGVIENVACTLYVLSPRAEHQFFFFTWQVNSLVTFHKKSQETAFIGQSQARAQESWICLPSLIQAKNSEDLAFYEPVNWWTTSQSSSFILTGGSSMRKPVPTSDALFGLLSQFSVNKRSKGGSWNTHAPPFGSESSCERGGYGETPPSLPWQMDTAIARNPLGAIPRIQPQ